MIFTVKVNTASVRSLEDTLRRKLPAELTRARYAFHQRLGFLVARDAKKNAPRSPTQRIASMALRRKKRSAQKRTPGQLEQSITSAATDRMTTIFVPNNSPAGKYAFRIERLKGIAWWNRGLGTIMKGSQADSLFIFRAIQANRGNALKLLQSELRKGLARCQQR